MNTRVYVVSVDVVVNCSVLLEKPRVFSNYISAVTFYSNCIEYARMQFKDGIDNNSFIEEMGNDCYEVYEDGYYAHNHYRVSIDEVIIED